MSKYVGFGCRIRGVWSLFYAVLVRRPWSNNHGGSVLRRRIPTGPIPARFDSNPGEAISKSSGTFSARGRTKNSPTIFARRIFPSRVVHPLLKGLGWQ
jgi:hypothetical protein